MESKEKPEAVVSPTPHPMPAASPATQTPADDTGGTTITNPIIQTPPGAAPPPAAPGSATPALTEALAQALAAQVMQVSDALAPYGGVLTASSKTHLQRPRVGIDLLVPLVVDLSTRYNVSWPDYPTSQFTADVALVSGLTEVDRPVEALSLFLNDSVFALRAGYLKAMQNVYVSLQRLAVTNPVLDEELAPIRRFFTNKPPAKRKPKNGGATPSNGAGTTLATGSTSSSAAGSSGTSSSAPALPPVVNPVASGVTEVPPAHLETVRAVDRRERRRESR